MTAVEFNHQLTSLEEALERFAMSLTMNREDAKDLVQETFLNVFRYLKEAAADPSCESLDRASSIPRQDPKLIPRTPRIFIKVNCLKDKSESKPPAAMISIDRKNRFICLLSVLQALSPSYIVALIAPGCRSFGPFIAGDESENTKVNGNRVISGNLLQNHI